MSATSLTCDCGTTYEDDATQQGSHHIWNRVSGHLLVSSNGTCESNQLIGVYDAALFWVSKRQGQDYTFSYGEDELENALWR